MGYEPEDLPWEVPLIELGLDSLMAVRIKNRVEYDFDLPPIQLTAVRDANLYAVEKLIQYAIEHRDQVERTRRAAEDADRRGDRRGAGRADGWGDDGRRTRGQAGRGWASAADAEVATEGASAMPDRARDPAAANGSGGSGHPAAADRSDRAPKQSAAGAAAAVLNQQAVAEALNADVPPRDAAERVTFATWAIVTGKSPGGIFNSLPSWTTHRRRRWRQRLSERAEGVITAEDVTKAQTIEELATTVRDFLEAGELDGFVRTIRKAEGDEQVPVYVFHAAGGSTVVYEPLLKRLPAGTPMIGLERVEGSIEERAAQYVPKLLEINGDKPFILAGWSLGGALAYACAIGLKQAGADVPFVGLIDCVRPGEPILHTKEETRKRWDRYAAFAQKTFNVRDPGDPVRAARGTRRRRVRCSSCSTR